MKKLFTLAVMVMVMAMGNTVFGQDVTTKPVVVKKNIVIKGDHDGDGIPNIKDKDFLTNLKSKFSRKNGVKNKTIKTLNKTCPNPNGQGLGDGTKPQPRDGTGFGPKVGQRQERNSNKRIRGDKGHGKKLRDGSCKMAGRKGNSRIRSHKDKSCQGCSRKGKCGHRRGHRHGRCRRPSDRQNKLIMDIIEMLLANSK